MKFKLLNHATYFHLCYEYASKFTSGIPTHAPLLYQYNDEKFLRINSSPINFKHIRTHDIYFINRTAEDRFHIRKNIFKQMFKTTVRPILLNNTKRNIKL